MATTPFVYLVPAGGLSRVVYPGPPPPVPVGSPPWMTKPGTIRWKVRPSKNPDFASATSDALVFGAPFASSSIVNDPQLVSTTSEYVFDASSLPDGFFCLREFSDGGASTFVQPLAAAEL